MYTHTSPIYMCCVCKHLGKRWSNSIHIKLTLFKPDFENMERFSLAANSLTQIEAMLEIICVVTVQSNYNSLFLSGNVLSKHKIFPQREKHIYYKLFSLYHKTSHLLCHGSFPLTFLCCSIRLRRSASMCLALSHVSLHRDVCPRLRDSNLPTQAHITV